MFPIQDCSRSIGLHVLLAIAFGITEYLVSGSSIQAYASCENLHGKMICSFKGSNETMDWYRAKQLCSSLNSTLLVIRNKNDQDAAAGYLKSHMNNSEVWTAGTNFTYSDWTWIDGKTLTDFVKGEDQETDQYDYGAMDNNFKFTAHAYSEKLPFICQHQRAYCNSFRDNFMIVSGKCLRRNNDIRTWYDARNHCFVNNGDLAVIGKDERGFLTKLKLNQSYWMGLRKQSWRWTLNDDPDSNDEIKYINWDNAFATHGQCIFLATSQGTWKTSGCSEKRRVVCERGQGTTSSAATEAMPTEAIHPFTYVSKESRNTTDELQSSIPQSLLFVSVGVGIVVIICIIVIVIFARGTKNGRSTLNYSYARNNREELDIRITNACAYTSINESADDPVDRSDDIRGVYADIALLTPEQSENGGTNQQPGIVYASLDFNKDPTNLEPNQTLVHSTSSPTKVGPLGDIYAIPDAKGHAVTSPSDKSASHPVKVTAQGDVYAIPMKISTSPTAKPPIGAVYANLQTATLDKEQMAVDYDETK